MKSNADDLSRRIIRSSIDWSGDGLTLVRFLAGRFTYRSVDEWWERIHSGEIMLNGEAAAPETVLKLHDCVEYFPGDLPEPEADLRYTIRYEDEFLLVADKSGNLCTHPAGPFFKHTLWHLLCSKYGKIHIVNRLDRETSGLLIAAKNPKCAAALGKAGAIVRKEYLALVFGNFSSPAEAVGFLTPDSASAVRKKRRFVPEMPECRTGLESCATSFFPERSGDRLSLVRALPRTGRLHQIRATLFSLGFPLVGDKLYGPDERIYLKLRSNSVSAAERELLLMPRQALHSAKLVFRHPVTGEEITVESPLPTDFCGVE